MADRLHYSRDCGLAIHRPWLRGRRSARIAPSLITFPTLSSCALDPLARGGDAQKPSFAQNIALPVGGSRDSRRGSYFWRFFGPDQSTHVSDVAFRRLAIFA